MTELSPRFGTPGSAALFVGRDATHDFFFYPITRVAVLRSADEELLLSQHEDNPGHAALYDLAHALFELTAQGEVIAHV